MTFGNGPIDNNTQITGINTNGGNSLQAETLKFSPGAVQLPFNIEEILKKFNITLDQYMKMSPEQQQNVVQQFNAVTSDNSFNNIKGLTVEKTTVNPSQSQNADVVFAEDDLMNDLLADEPIIVSTQTSQSAVQSSTDNIEAELTQSLLKEEPKKEQKLTANDKNVIVVENDHHHEHGDKSVDFVVNISKEKWDLLTDEQRQDVFKTVVMANYVREQEGYSVRRWNNFSAEKKEQKIVEYINEQTQKYAEVSDKEWSKYSDLQKQMYTRLYMGDIMEKVGKDKFPSFIQKEFEKYDTYIEDIVENTKEISEKTFDENGINIQFKANKSLDDLYNQKYLRDERTDETEENQRLRTVLDNTILKDLDKKDPAFIGDAIKKIAENSKTREEFVRYSKALGYNSFDDSYKVAEAMNNIKDEKTKNIYNIDMAKTVTTENNKDFVEGWTKYHRDNIHKDKSQDYVVMRICTEEEAGNKEQATTEHKEYIDAVVGIKNQDEQIKALYKAKEVVLNSKNNKNAYQENFLENGKVPEGFNIGLTKEVRKVLNADERVENASMVASFGNKDYIKAVIEGDVEVSQGDGLTKNDIESLKESFNIIKTEGSAKIEEIHGEEAAKEYEKDLSDTVKQYNKIMQSDLFKMVMNTKFDEVKEYAASNINKLDASVQADALQAVLESGNEKAIQAAAEQLAKCEPEVQKKTEEYVVQKSADLYAETVVKADIASGKTSSANIEHAKQAEIQKFAQATPREQFEMLSRLGETQQKSALTAICRFAPSMLEGLVGQGFGSKILSIPGISTDVIYKVIETMVKTGGAKKTEAYKYIIKNKSLFRKETVEEAQASLTAEKIGAVDKQIKNAQPQAKESFFKSVLGMQFPPDLERKTKEGELDLPKFFFKA